MLQIKSLIKFIVPLILVGIIFSMTYFLSEKYYYGLATVTSVNFLEVVSGEITSILVGINLGLNPVIAGSFIIFLESDISLFVAWNFDVLKKAPKVGRKLVDYEEKMREIIEKKRWIKTVQFLGVMTIAFIPFYVEEKLASCNSWGNYKINHYFGYYFLGIHCYYMNGIWPQYLFRFV